MILLNLTFRLYPVAIIVTTLLFIILIYSDVVPIVFFMIIVIILWHQISCYKNILISTDPVLFFSYIPE